MTFAQAEFILYEADGTALAVENNSGTGITVYESDATELTLQLQS